VDADVFHGIDFSGGAGPWRARVSVPTVWVSTVANGRLIDLRAVQALEGSGSPFERLVALLRAGRFAAAGIDAPFCIPARHLPDGGHDALVAAVGVMPVADDRPFPRGAALMDLARSVAGLESAKPLRATEQAWRARGVNIRSTLWNGPRGGAPFAAACLTLQAQVGRPVWPWNVGDGMLVEAFPAAQVKAWGLSPNGYGRADQVEVRRPIVEAVSGRIDVPAPMRKVMVESPDALDAVLAAFGAMAAVSGALVDEVTEGAMVEGAIAVHR
jgi:hypothetical protein